MTKVYRSTVQFAFLLPLLALLILEGFLISESYWILAAIALIPVLFLIYLYLNTSYELRDQKLRVKSGFFFEKEIYINSIRKIRPARSMSASPAFSHDRLEIFYNRYNSVQISPEHRVQFLEELKKINPRITIEESERRRRATPSEASLR